MEERDVLVRVRRRVSRCCCRCRWSRSGGVRWRGVGRGVCGRVCVIRRRGRVGTVVSGRWREVGVVRVVDHCLARMRGMLLDRRSEAPPDRQMTVACPSVEQSLFASSRCPCEVARQGSGQLPSDTAPCPDSTACVLALIHTMGLDTHLVTP